jgi:hypothetical protein
MQRAASHFQRQLQKLQRGEVATKKTDDNDELFSESIAVVQIG